MTATRRTLLGASLLAAASTGLPRITSAQDATPMVASPEAVPLDRPGYGIIRVRTLATETLNQAVFADVMRRFLPATEAIPGFGGYLFANETENPASALTMTLLDTMESAVEADTVAREYVAGLDPRLTPETPLAVDGPIRIYATTDRPPSELPPFLTGCSVTSRNRTNAADTDIEAVLALVNDDLVPQLESMEGFILYGWMMRAEGRISFNIWETAEQLAGGDTFIADWVAANPTITSSGAAEVHAGTIAYANVLGGAD